MDGDLCRRLGAELAAYFGRRHGLFTGRGATAIYLALRALPARRGKVVMPTTLCPSPANAALYAGFEPLFCDVSPDDFNLDPESLERVLAATPDAVAVIAPHLYGHPADLPRILAIARNRGVAVIEDAAQAMGGEFEGRRLGSFGDASIVSFGHTKILDAGWGGAVLTDDDRLAERMEQEAAALPAPPAGLDGLYALYRRVYYALKPLAAADDRLDGLFEPLPRLFREMYLFRPREAWAEAVLARLDGIESAVAARRAHAAAYAERLQGSAVTLPRVRAGGVPWRFSLLLPAGDQDRVTSGLRAAGLDASNWYPPLHRWYASGRAQDRGLFAGAEAVATRILNLWVEPDIDENYPRRACDALVHLLREPATTAPPAADRTDEVPVP